VRTYENLVKRINAIEAAYKEVPKNLDYKNAILAYRMQTFLKQSYKTLALNGIKIIKEEE
jgi:hypothetical protein